MLARHERKSYAHLFTSVSIVRLIQTYASINRLIQTYASNASDVQTQVMCKCEFVALGGEGVGVVAARGYLSGQPAS